MARGLSYADAARLLGGGDSKIVTRLDKITGGILLGAVVGVPALLGWLEARAEFAQLCQDLVRAFADRRSGLSRYGRTQRLYAAHGVLVVTAFFEALAEADLPFRFGDLKVTKAEEMTIAGDGSGLGTSLGSLMEVLLSLVQETVPVPQEPYESLLESLEHGYYPHLCTEIEKFTAGLAVWDQLTETKQDRFSRALQTVPTQAVARYEELFRRLAAEFPEVAFWASLRENQATRAEVRSLGIALTGLERQLGDISTGRAPGGNRAALMRAYHADLQRPIVESGDVPDGLLVPALGEAYVPPPFRAQGLTFAEDPSEEWWWEQIDVREELEEFLIGFLTSPEATQAPLLVLGQPGSGKSVLTRVLAARLPAADFMPVRVILREVSAHADLQDQLEHAVRSATGERVDWAALARSADDALPVILLDGFDELLQATEVGQSDYLARVASFQQREAAQGRPAAVIVTSRISVAGRARVPGGSVVLRLEPFDPPRVTAWLDIWNTVNAAQFEARGLQPLTPEAVMAHGDLARQPLLLLMLALYDADGNPLQHMPADIGQGELYERLLHRFASREIVKDRPGLPDRDLEQAIETELDCLSVVAFAMFNRGSQWVTEADLDNDLARLPDLYQTTGPTAASPPPRAAEFMFGRFFFVHRARAQQGGIRRETYEFLHATFGEFLVARFTLKALSDITARHSATVESPYPIPLSEDLLHALLSFSVLSVRASIVGFLAEGMARLADTDRAAQASLVKRLFRVADEQRPRRRFRSYQPLTRPVTSRHAAYTANLLLLAVSAASRIWASDLVGDQASAVDGWHRHALLWRSQLGTEEWNSLTETLAVERLWRNRGRDLRLSLDNGTFTVPVIDPAWTYDLEPSRRPGDWHIFGYTSQASQVLRRMAHFVCGINDDVVYHALEPLLNLLGDTVDLFVEGFPDGACVSPANALLGVWLLPLREPASEERRAVYERCAVIAASRRPGAWDDQTRSGYAALLLDRLTTDRKASADLAADVLERFPRRWHGQLVDQIATSLIQCSLAFLGQEHESDIRLADVLSDVLMPDLSSVEISLGLEALARLAELGLPLPDLLQLEAGHGDQFFELVDEVAEHRHDIAERVQRLMGRGGAYPPPRDSDSST